ncbi:hypothetical protein DFJ73DRAFT_793863 [Zopfochytrium polystomum]|nr:hypothetical protein DFJ73DRAFT_793863 [Zopfochytrium polystomum]
MIFLTGSDAAAERERPVPAAGAAALVAVAVTAAAAGFAGLPAAAAAGTAGAASAPRPAARCTDGLLYTGATCPSSVLDYPVAVPSATTAASWTAAEARVAAIANRLALLQGPDPDCYSALITLACVEAFPLCLNGTTQLPCISTCQAAVSLCEPHFASIGAIALLNELTEGCQSDSAELLPEQECFTQKSVGVAYSKGLGRRAAAGAKAETKCPAFFLPAPSATFANTSNNCDPASGCCIPCPSQAYFYPVGAFNRIVDAALILNMSSAGLACYVLLSWALLPGRRSHPSDIVLHFSISVVLWMAGQGFTAGNPRRIQCADDVTLANAQNNPVCAAMGAYLVYITQASILWSAYMVFNVHLTIVWRSNFLERYKVPGIIICWGLPATLTGLVFALSTVDASAGVACFVSPAKANLLYFTGMMVFVIPSVLVTVYTVVWISFKARGWKGQSASGGSNPSSNAVDDLKPISSRKQLMMVLKSNWRSLLFGIAFLITFVTYFTFFNLFVIPTANFSSATPFIQQWQACVVKTFTATQDVATAQNECAAQVAGNVPSLAALVAAAITTGFVGIWTFLIFGVNSTLLVDWADYCGACCGGGGENRRPGRVPRGGVPLGSAAGTPDIVQPWRAGGGGGGGGGGYDGKAPSRGGSPAAYPAYPPSGAGGPTQLGAGGYYAADGGGYGGAYDGRGGMAAPGYVGQPYRPQSRSDNNQPVYGGAEYGGRRTPDGSMGGDGYRRGEQDPSYGRQQYQQGQFNGRYQ